MWRWKRPKRVCNTRAVISTNGRVIGLVHLRRRRRKHKSKAGSKMAAPRCTAGCATTIAMRKSKRCGRENQERNKGKSEANCPSLSLFYLPQLPSAKLSSGVEVTGAFYVSRRKTRFTLDRVHTLHWRAKLQVRKEKGIDAKPDDVHQSLEQSPSSSSSSGVIIVLRVLRVACWGSSRFFRRPHHQSWRVSLSKRWWWTTVNRNLTIRVILLFLLLAGTLSLYLDNTPHLHGDCSSMSIITYFYFILFFRRWSGRALILACLCVTKRTECVFVITSQ